MFGPIFVLPQREDFSHAPPATPTAEVTGDLTSTNEVLVRAGGLTANIEVTDTEWLAAGAAFNAVRLIILAHIAGTNPGATWWNAAVLPLLDENHVLRLDANNVQIGPLPVAPLYSINATETVTVTVPGEAVLSGQDIAAGTLTITRVTPPSAEGAVDAGIIRGVATTAVGGTIYARD